MGGLKDQSASNDIEKGSWAEGPKRVIAFHTRDSELARGWDVLVHPEEVVRVVLLLDVGKPRVGGALVLLGVVRVVGRSEVDVTTFARERLAARQSRRSVTRSLR